MHGRVHYRTVLKISHTSCPCGEGQYLLIVETKHVYDFDLQLHNKLAHFARDLSRTLIPSYLFIVNQPSDITQLKYYSIACVSAGCARARIGMRYFGIHVHKDEVRVIIFEKILSHVFKNAMYI